MFLHIGQNVSIPLKNVIAIYDIKNKKNDEFILAMKERIEDISKSLPKSCIVTDNKIYISSISASTLYNRSIGQNFMAVNK
ncbi:extracellular matrix regulator RemB [Pectinatus haikarae]|uniref:extracellular matrix regulator RemB n=1 Tax=Pectinatus haikarae TaxID=349096 RepID=UPI0018C728DB|nr:extracellular matrix/biofilm biosynthesis regulator RemA family protein [Pectinatus haikarae]